MTNRILKIDAARTGRCKADRIRISVTLLLALAIVADALSFFRSFPRAHRFMATTVPVPRPAPPLTSSIVAAHLFGVAPATAESANRVSATLKLTGTIVWEGDADRGYAILGPSEQQTQAFSSGMSVDNGTRLDRVFRDHVRLAVNDGYVTVALPHNALHDLFASTARPPPGGPRTDAMSAERTWLGDLVAQPSFDDGHFQGFMLSPTKNIRQRFDLRDGDVVTEINGVALDRPTSAEAVLQKLGGNMVLMTVIRNGSPQLVSMDMSGS
jgi:type II secretory pathway component PulC